MKIQLASDLHHEIWVNYLQPNPLVLNDGADALILPGDIGTPWQVKEFYGKLPVPVLYVPGNHEYFDADFKVHRKAMADLFEGTSIHLLDNKELILGGVRFLGATLWTDFALDGNVEKGMMAWKETLHDAKHLSIDGAPVTADFILREHQASKLWLLDKLNTPFDGKTVVITHHGPHRKSIVPAYRTSGNNSAFVSNLDMLVSKADFWFHGHTHASTNYKAEGCRVITNPQGYPRATDAQKKMIKLLALFGGDEQDIPKVAHENKSFKKNLLIDL